MGEDATYKIPFTHRGADWVASINPMRSGVGPGPRDPPDLYWVLTRRVDGSSLRGPAFVNDHDLTEGREQLIEKCRATIDRMDEEKGRTL